MSLKLSHLLLLGNFNFPGINWDSRCIPTSSTVSTEYYFLENIRNNYLFQHVTLPTLQEDLNRLDQWSAKWQMLFNQSKCKCFPIGRANGKEPYEMHNTVLLKTSKEKDIGMTISADWKVSEQCGIGARKGNQLLGMIKRNITYR